MSALLRRPSVNESIQVNTVIGSVNGSDGLPFNMIKNKNGNNDSKQPPHTSKQSSCARINTTVLPPVLSNTCTQLHENGEWTTANFIASTAEWLTYCER
eukprot:m.368268 g.368268  ORF g.368268 m.368268 type:complete len:99 (+) comp44390_c0_seq1:3-299(+)